VKINSLTALRFFAALGVFLHHFHFYEHTQNGWLQYTYKAFFEGFVGVTFFYVLSGFIISYSYHNQAKRRPYTTGEFLFNRFARLYPVHFLTLGAAIAAYYGMANLGAVDGKVLAVNAALLQAFVPDPLYFFSFNGVSWSISVEVFFYLAFITLFVRLRTRYLAILGAALSLGIAYLMLGPLANHPLNSWTFYINPAFRAVDFIAGMLIFRVFSSGRFQPTAGQSTALEVGSLILLVAFAYVGMKHVPMTWRYDLFYLVPMMLVVWAFSHGQGIVSRLISNRLFVLLGEASFSLYMVHQIVIALALRNSTVNIDEPNQVLWFIGVTTITGVVVSVAMYEMYEKPINDYLRKVWKRRSAKASTGHKPA
jgi:peptidoglycan/LPS O-acetylase OafA/YrhL